MWSQVGSLVGAAIDLDISWWVLVFGVYGYVVCGGCPLAWTGYSIEGFSGLRGYLKLSVASGVMLCLKNWYYRILVTGYLKNATVAVNALSICMTINGWELMIPLAFFAGAGVRVELGSGNGKGAKFTMQVSVIESLAMGVFFCVMIMAFHHQVASIFTSTCDVLEAVDHIAFLLAVTILLNSVQPVLSGVAGNKCRMLLHGWAPTGFLLGCLFKLGVQAHKS